MQPKLEKIPVQHASSITVKREITPYMDYPWHYHPEHEIIFVEKSYGIRFMGNHIGNFSDGDLMFISSNLPHVWKNDNDFYQGNKALFVDVYVIHFRDDVLGNGFFDLPECMHIKKLFERGQQGVLIQGADHRKISGLVKDVVAATGMERLLLFLKTLETIALTKDYELLSSAGYTSTVNTSDTERINVVMNYIMQHFADDITVEEIASLSNLTVSSFCRYFKSRTQKTFSEFLNEVRILNACKLLVKKEMTITQICYETGYNNISHFNRQFKLITGLTAKAYAKKYRQNLL
ncbi:MAG: AraC family transcriptional regulator [Chitinophagaceae bacterium]|nr:AraC family transcriptional regulator [Chitinophagaceae bacterium]